jgi:hypothetical protein
MLSDQNIDAKDFDFIQQNLTEQQIKELGNANNKRQVINGTIVITKPNDDYTDTMNKINAATGTKDIRDILIILTNKFYNK